MNEHAGFQCLFLVMVNVSKAVLSLLVEKWDLNKKIIFCYFTRYITQPPFLFEF